MQFICAALGHCHYHPAMPQFKPGENVGFYPCCDAVVYRFDTAAWQTGCTVRDHTVDMNGPDGRIHQQLLKHRDVATVPYRRVVDTHFAATQMRNAVAAAQDGNIVKPARGATGGGTGTGGDPPQSQHAAGRNNIAAATGPFAHLTNRPHSPRGDENDWSAMTAVASTSMTSWAAVGGGALSNSGTGTPTKHAPPGFLVDGDTIEEDDVVDADDEFTASYTAASRSAMPMAPLAFRPPVSGNGPQVDARHARVWALEEQRLTDEERMAGLMHRLEVLRGDKRAGLGSNCLRTFLAL